MSATFERVRRQISEQKLLVSEHGLERLFKYDISLPDILEGVEQGTVVEDYPNYAHGPSVLVLQTESGKLPVHVVWGLPNNQDDIVVLVTAYRPDPERWDEAFKVRLR